MKILFSILFLFLYNSESTEDIKLITSIKIEGNGISTDPLGNCYVENNRKVFKFDYDGKLINNYSNNNFGDISSMDATNPYKLLLFYQKFGKIIFVDNMLSENSSSINLIGTPYNQAKLVCHSFDNGFWVYEPILNELIKLNQNLQPIQQSGNLSRILRKKLDPNFLIEFNSRIYMNNPLTGILVFDQYGTYIKSIPIKNLTTFQVREERIHYLNNNKLITYFFKTLDSDTTDLPIQENLIDVQIQKKRMFILTKESLKLYQLK